MFAVLFGLIEICGLRCSGHPLIADERNCERLVLSTPDFALQNRPLKGGRLVLVCGVYRNGVNGYFSLNFVIPEYHVHMQ